jgi:hypothetical protein
MRPTVAQGASEAARVCEAKPTSVGLQRHVSRMRAQSHAIIAAGALLLMGGSTETYAFDDTQFCHAVTQIARAASRDVGIWLDRTTRNDGIEVFCNRKLVHLKRYSSTPTSTVRETWTERKTDEWRGTYCTNPMWREAVDNGWLISATVTTAGGQRVWFACQPGGSAFHRVLP